MPRGVVGRKVEEGAGERGTGLAGGRAVGKIRLAARNTDHVTFR